MIVWVMILLPLCGGVIAARLARYAPQVAAATLVTTTATGAWVALTQASANASWGPRLELTTAAQDLTRVMVVMVPVIALPIVLYAAATQAGGRARLVALLTAFVGPMELLVVAQDFLTLLIGWELVGAMSWLLIAHEWRDASNAQQATHAFVTTRVGDLGLYVAAGLAFASTGSFAFSSLSDAGSQQLGVVAAGVVVAAAAKSAQVPFSPWLFSAMAGPTPVSALLHSSTMVAAGAYLLVRLSAHLDAVTWFAPAVVAIGLTSAFAGGIVAAVHRHPKRLLAGSTSAQYGLMFVAVGVGSVVAAATQLVTHAAFKSLLFLSAGTAMHEAASDDVARMRLGRRVPFVAGSAAIGALALAAVPPLGGAWSKEQIAAAAFESSWVIGAAIAAAGALSAFYGIRFWLLVFGPRSERTSSHGQPSGALAIGALALFSVTLTVLWVPRVGEAVAGLLRGHVVDARAAEFIVGLVAIAAGAGVAVLLDRRDQLVQGTRWTPVVSGGTAWFGIADITRAVVVAPVLAASRTLAAFDDRVVDAGVRVTARIADRLSRLLRRRSEVSLDAIVDGIAGGTFVIAARSGALDDNTIDRATEQVAAGIGRAGDLLRKLQTGLTHHYYVIVTVGVLALGVVLAAGTS